MERGTNAWTPVSHYVARVALGLSRRSALLIVGVSSVGFLWIVSVAPAPVAFVLTAGLAAAWCAWLERHPEAPQDTDPCSQGVPSAGTTGRLTVAVLATTHEGTRSALTVAKRLTTGNDARVVLVVPRLTAFTAQFDPTGPERATLVDEHRALAADEGVHVSVLFCVCRRLDDVAHQLLGRSGLVIVGGRRHLWWPSREQRLAERLISEGYAVVFVQAGAPAAPASAKTPTIGFGAAVCLIAAATSAAGQTVSDSAVPLPSAAQEQTASNQQDPSPWRNVKFGATLEGYYEYNWNRPPDRTLVLRAYDTRSNTFGIQQVALVVDAAPDVDANRRYGLRLDLQFGQATETVQGSPANEPRPDVYRHVWQVYGTYLFPVGAKGLQADFGKFASMLGYETNYAKDNQAFSRAYLFNLLPFYHSGLRLTLPVNEKVSVLYMLTNGIQQTEEFNDFKSNHVAAIVTPTSAVTWTINHYFGQEQPDGGEPGGPDGFFRVFDTYVTVTPTAALTLGADVNYTTNELNAEDAALSLQGTGVYARYQLTDRTAVGVRYERLDDEGLFGGIDQVLHEATFTAEHKLADGFLVRVEFRRDWSNERFFPGRGGAGDVRRQQNTALLGAVWVIGNKAGVW